MSAIRPDRVFRVTAPLPGLFDLPGAYVVERPNGNAWVMLQLAADDPRLVALKISGATEEVAVAPSAVGIALEPKALPKPKAARQRSTQPITRGPLTLVVPPSPKANGKRRRRVS